jgi:hypothetical protein
LALTIEYFRRPALPAGLGLLGAVAINLCGAAFVIGWLASGCLAIPVRGQVFLWAVALILIAISSAELYSAWRRPIQP